MVVKNHHEHIEWIGNLNHGDELHWVLLLKYVEGTPRYYLNMSNNNAELSALEDSEHELAASGSIKRIRKKYVPLAKFFEVTITHVHTGYINSNYVKERFEFSDQITWTISFKE